MVRWEEWFGACFPTPASRTLELRGWKNTLLLPSWERCQGMLRMPSTMTEAEAGADAKKVRRALVRMMVPLTSSLMLVEASRRAQWMAQQLSAAHLLVDNEGLVPYRKDGEEAASLVVSFVELCVHEATGGVDLFVEYDRPVQWVRICAAMQRLVACPVEEEPCLLLSIETFQKEAVALNHLEAVRCRLRPPQEVGFTSDAYCRCGCRSSSSSASRTDEEEPNEDEGRRTCLMRRGEPAVIVVHKRPRAPSPPPPPPPPPRLEEEEEEEEGCRLIRRRVRRVRHQNKLRRLISSSVFESMRKLMPEEEAAELARLREEARTWDRAAGAVHVVMKETQTTRAVYDKQQMHIGQLCGALEALKAENGRLHQLLLANHSHNNNNKGCEPPLLIAHEKNENEGAGDTMRMISALRGENVRLSNEARISQAEMASLRRQLKEVHRHQGPRSVACYDFEAQHLACDATLDRIEAALARVVA